MVAKMKTITIGLYKQKILVDDADYERCNVFNWVSSGSNTIRIIASTRENGKHLSLANFVMNTRGIKYDHKDLNPYNNQKNNLRITNSQLNRANTTKDLFLKEATSEYKGVSWHKATKKWRAYITFKDKHISLGYYMNPELAAKAYDRKALELFGEFAYLNFRTK